MCVGDERKCWEMSGDVIGHATKAGEAKGRGGLSLQGDGGTPSIVLCP